MASRISQMRNAQPQSQHQLNQSIEAVRSMMAQVKNSPMMLEQILQNNPNTAIIANLLRGGNSLENIARSMASANGIDINTLINQLGGI